MPDSDNLYPNDSPYMWQNEPIEQKRQRKQEKAEVLKAEKAIVKVIDHFNERIAERDKLSSIKADITTSPELHQKAFEVNRLLRQVLREEKELLEELLEANQR